MSEQSAAAQAAAAITPVLVEAGEPEAVPGGDIVALLAGRPIGNVAPQPERTSVDLDDFTRHLASPEGRAEARLTGKERAERYFAAQAEARRAARAAAAKAAAPAPVAAALVEAPAVEHGELEVEDEDDYDPEFENWKAQQRELLGLDDDDPEAQ